MLDQPLAAAVVTVVHGAPGFVAKPSGLAARSGPPNQSTGNHIAGSALRSSGMSGYGSDTMLNPASGFTADGAVFCLPGPCPSWYPQSLLEPRIPADPCRSGPTKFPEERCSGSVDAARSFLLCCRPSRLPIFLAMELAQLEQGCAVLRN